MESAFLVILFLLNLLGGLYFILIAAYTFGWFRLKYFHANKQSLKTFVSVILPARNEAENIEQCLKDLLSQSADPQQYEIILVDDQSDDATFELAQQVKNKNKDRKINLLKLGPDEGAGKKNAIALGVKAASGDLIMTIDADCRLQKNWLLTLLKFYEEHKPKFISAPVVFYDEKTHFEKLQSLEFLSLIASGAGSVSINAPIMCNGANLAYEKKAFLAVDGYSSNSQIVSGDDVFLMLKIKKTFGENSVRFLKNRNAIVYTRAKPTLSEFLDQRIRWVSKSKAYTDLSIISASLLVYLFNYLILVALVTSIWIDGLFMVSLVFFLLKSLIDLPILIGISSFAQKKKLLIYFLPLQVIYIVYVSIIGMIGNFVKFSWKGRPGK
jgi:cellulose synthase/poly-beta-1,6-N-acetylglucosamine synthase-like glycosyltransferase